MGAPYIYDISRLRVNDVMISKFYIISCFKIFMRVWKNCEEQLWASSHLSIRIGQLGSHWTDFNKILDLRNFRKSVEIEIKFYYSLTIKNTLHDDMYDGISLILLRMRNVWCKICRQTQNTYFIVNKVFRLWKSCRIWDNVKKIWQGQTGL